MNQCSLMKFSKKADFNRWVEKEIPRKYSTIYKYLAYDEEGIPNQQGRVKLFNNGTTKTG